MESKNELSPDGIAVKGGGEATTTLMESDQFSPAGNDNITAIIEGVLRDTQERFQAMSDQIIHRIDEMAKRVDDLEKNITDLMAEAGINNSDNR